MKKRFAWLGTLLLVCMAAYIAFSYCWETGLFAPEPEPDPLPENMTWGPPVSSAEEGETDAVSSDETSSIDADMPLIVSLDGTVQVDGVKFTLHSVTYSKDTQGMSPPLTFFGAWGDYDGTLVSEHTYVIVELTAENIAYAQALHPQLSPEELPEITSIGLNSLQLVAYEGAEMVVDGRVSEPAITDFDNGDDDPNHTFIYDNFRTGEILHYRVGFIVADELLHTMTGMYLLPNLINNTWVYDEATGTSHWAADTQFIWMMDMVNDLTVPERTYIPPAAPRPVCSADGTYDNAVLRVQMLGAAMAEQVPEDALLLQEETTGVRYVCVDIQQDNLSWQESRTWFGTSPQLMVYNGEELAAALAPHAVQYDEKVTPFVPKSQAFKIPPESTMYFTLVYAVPEEYFTGEYDLLFNLYKWQTYDPATRAVVWKENGVVIDLNNYLQGE